MPQVLVLSGLPCSGKTTHINKALQKTPNTRIIDVSSIRDAIGAKPFDASSDAQVNRIRDSIFLDAMRRGEDIFIDDFNLGHTNYDHFARMVDEHNTSIMDIYQEPYQIALKVLNVDLPTLIARDLERPNSLGPDILRALFKQYAPQDFAKEPDNAYLPRAIICMLDDVLALTNHQNPKGLLSIKDSKINKQLADLIFKLVEPEADGSSLKVIYITSLKENLRQLTYDWLESYNLPCETVLMRPANFNMPKGLLNYETYLYNEYIAGNYSVKYIFDSGPDRIHVWTMNTNAFVIDVP